MDRATFWGPEMVTRETEAQHNVAQKEQGRTSELGHFQAKASPAFHLPDGGSAITYTFQSLLPHSAFTMLESCSLKMCIEAGTVEPQLWCRLPIGAPVQVPLAPC